MENKTQWKLPSEVAFEKWELNHEEWKWHLEGEDRCQRKSEALEARSQQAESDLTAALDLLGNKRNWLQAIKDEMGEDWFLFPRFEAEIAEIDNHLKQYKPTT